MKLWINGILAIIMKSKACIYLFLGILFLILLYIAKSKNFTTIFGAAAAFYLAGHVLTNYLAKKTIDFGWVTVRYKNNPLERLFYLLASFFFLGVAIFALLNGW